MTNQELQTEINRIEKYKNAYFYCYIVCIILSLLLLSFEFACLGLFLLILSYDIGNRQALYQCEINFNILESRINEKKVL